MTTIRVRDLRQRAREILRRIREDKAEYLITYRGKPVAVLLPVEADAVDQASSDVGEHDSSHGWDAYAKVAAAVREQWPGSVSTEAVLDEIRR